MTNDRKKEAFARRKAIKKVNESIAQLDTEDILWLAEIGSRLVDKNKKKAINVATDQTLTYDW